MRQFHGWSRRRFVAGAGATLGLPWLEALAAPRRLSPPPGPVRLAVLVMPNGVLPSAWTPTPAADGGFEPSFALQPLAAWRDQVTVCTGLANRQSFDGDGHYAKVAPLLTGCRIARTGGRELRNGISCDQLAAQQLGGRTPLPSLELGCDPIYPVEDMGYSTVYGGTISWSAAERPCSKEIVPQRVFDRLFRATALARDPARPSVLDVVKQDADALLARLGTTDRQKLLEYQDSVRDLERRLAAVAARPGDTPAGGVVPPGVPREYPEHLRLMFDLLALAFATDTTRLATFLLANEVSGRDFGFVDGCAGNFHDFSHHGGDPAKQAAYRRINRWHVEQFAGFLQRLHALQEGGTTVLARSMVVLAAAMADGNAHDPHDLPVLLAGGGDGTLQPGRLLASPADTPLCSLWLALLQRLGCDVEQFGDATAPLL